MSENKTTMHDNVGVMEWQKAIWCFKWLSLGFLSLGYSFPSDNAMLAS